MIGIGILLGGKSQRMGRPKSELDYFGVSYLDRLINLWEDFPIYLSIGEEDEEKYGEHPCCILLKDSFPSSGPVGGIYEILKRSEYKWNFICAVDLPFIKKEIPSFLELFIEEHYDCILFTKGDRLHPLCGLYRKELEKIFESSLLQNKLKLVQLIESLRVKYIPIELTNFPQNLLDNINYPEDYIKSFGNCISICGFKNTGKTTFISNVLRELKKKNAQITVLKHDGNHDFDIDQNGTDTDCYRKAGAQKVIIFNDKKSAEISSFDEAIDYKDILENERRKQDFIFIEGLKNEPLPKFEILRQGISEIPGSNEINRLGFITDFPFEGEGLHFDLNNPKDFAEYIYNTFIVKK